MRRLIVFPALSLLLATVSLLPGGQANAGAAEDRPAGVVFAGLRRDAGLCRGAFGLTTAGREELCSHGPDPAPPGIDVRRQRAPEPSWAFAGTMTPGLALAGSTQCYGTGADGPRVQLLYARASDRADRYAQYRTSFNQWAASMDAVFDQSALETGGSRHVRFVHDASCTPIVDNVVLSATGDDTFNNTINELRAKGYTRTDRKYLVWMDANVYCGIAQIYSDDRPTQDNYSNASSVVKGEFGRVDNGCWGLAGQSVEAHEVMHTMGGVQTSAPHATRNSHCWDESDRMCYADGSGVAMRQVCTSQRESLFDCNHDDYYFAGTPPAGNYLATHWNVANSVFLAGTSGSGGTQPPPPPPPGPTAPSAPRNLTATSPVAGGIKLTWQAPSSNGGSAVTGYEIYRRTATTSYVLIKTTANLTWRDQAAAPGTTSSYVVRARNSVGVGPDSNEVSAAPR